MIFIKNVMIPHGEGWIRRNILIDKGVYVTISESSDERISKDCQLVRGDGRFLIPAPIDPHVHVREPGYEYKEDWETCTKAALKGGISTIFDMPNNREPIIDYQSLMNKKAIGLKKSYVNFGLYVALTDDNVKKISLPKIQNEICGIKVYLSKTTGDITVERENSLIQVFYQSKPVLVHTGGYEGLNRMLFCYEKVSSKLSSLPVLYICHISTREEVKRIREWKRRFPRIYAEVTPHHLYLTKENYQGYRGVLPELASQSDVDALWGGVIDGTVDVVGSDHAPHTIEEKKREPPPSGFPGLETLLPLLFRSYKDNRISLKTLICLTSENAGKIFHLKGHVIILNGTANCVLIGEEEFIVGKEGYLTKCAWSPFHGWKLRYKPVTTIVNGSIAFSGDNFYKPPVNYQCI